MFLILTLVLIVMAIRGVALLIKGEVTDKDYVIRGTVARLIGLCWVSSIILYFVLIALETAVLGASSDAGETTARLLISAIIAIVIGLASAELLKRSSGGKAKTAKSPGGGGPKGKRDFDSLVQTLGDAGHSGSDRVSAATELGEMGDVRAVEPLIAAPPRRIADSQGLGSGTPVMSLRPLPFLSTRKRRSQLIGHRARRTIPSD